jgi:hypothetical protein
MAMGLLASERSEKDSILHLLLSQAYFSPAIADERNASDLTAVLVAESRANTSRL